MRKFSLVLVFIAFCLLVIDVIKGPGTSSRHIFIDGKFIWAVTFVLMFFVINTKSKIADILSKFNLFTLIVTSFAYLFFVYAEATHFPNYVLSTFKIHLDGLVFIPFFCLSFTIAEKCKNEFVNIPLKRFTDYFFVTIVTLTIYFSFWNLGIAINTSLNKDFYIFFHTNSSYNEKMYFEWGNFYNLMSFVKNNTPKNATIIIPPEIEPWLGWTGDIKLVRGFLYPRTIIQYKDRNIDNLKLIEKGSFLLVSWGDRNCGYPDCHGWPNQKIKTQKILYKDPNSDQIIEMINDYIFTKDNYKYVYGLVEI